MFSYSEFQHTYKIPHMAIHVPKSEDYRVFAKGTEIPVYTCRISRYPFNSWWPGYERPVDQTEVVSYINLVGDEAVTLEIEAKKAHSRILVKPYSKGLIAEEKDGKIRLALPGTGFFVLELDDYHGLLYIFYSKPIEAPAPESVTHYFGPGVHYPRQISLSSGDRIYIDKDALVFGNLFGDGVENVEIFGNGILDDMGEGRFSLRCYPNYTVGNVKFYNSKNITIRGVGMMNSAIWCMSFFACEDITVDGVKIFGQWRYNADGIDFCNSKNVSLENSFIHAFDDAIVIKGVLPFTEKNVENIHVKGCTVWCDWGKTLEIGVETACIEYNDISFEDIDILRAGNTAMDIGNGYTAYVHNVRYENIRIEINAFDTREQLQENLEMKYTRGNEIAQPYIFYIFNRPWGWEGSPFEKSAGNRISEKTAWVTDVLAKDITVYYDEGMPTENGKPILPVRISNDRAEAGAKFENIRLENLVCNGKKMTESEIRFEYNNAEKIEYK